MIDRLWCVKLVNKKTDKSAKTDGDKGQGFSLIGRNENVRI